MTFPTALVRRRTLCEIQRLLERMTLPPRCRAEVVDNAEGDAIWIHLFVKVPCVKTGEEIEVSSCKGISSFELEVRGTDPADAIEQVLAQLWISFHRHEWDEWFRIDGVRTNEPH